MSRYRVTVDTGGTFSDFVLFDEETGAYRILKVPSTSDDPGRAVLDGLDVLQEQGVHPEEITFFSHGTTVATNALIQDCLLYTSPSPRDRTRSRMPSSA